MSSESPFAIPLNAEVVSNLSFQAYGAGRPIDGVFVHPLRKHRALEGSFMELVRLSDGKVDGLPIDFDVRQISYSIAVANRINAFHLHPKRRQDELWCVLSGLLNVWLVDCREGSPTNGVRQRVVLSGENPSFLYIPAGVAHGYKSGADGATLVYLMNDQFSIDDPNEGRLPWDLFGRDLWDEDRG